VPVGYPVDHKEVLLLDEAGTEIGFNRTGEIAVKSHYLSLGYWRKPELTQVKFKPDPQGGDQRIYLTGDLGRMAPDGCLFHLGRKDFQVKVRGYRVEVSEIEMALLEHAAVKEAAVVGREIQSGDRQLVTYFVPTREPAATVTELRNFLKDRLPDYMIPSAFVMLPALPLTPNGRVDHLALPAPEGTRPELDTPFAAPRTPIEAELAKIWADVLSLDQVGIHDNFFDLGGHSLAATRVVSQVIKQFRLDLPLQSLFQSPTVAEMAAVIDERQKNRLTEEELERILTELEAMSEEEAKKISSAHDK
jgi:acyl carrier protein